MIFILVSSLLYGAVMPFAVSSLATPDVEPKHGYLNYRHYLYYLHYLHYLHSINGLRHQVLLFCIKKCRHYELMAILL
jgi:hypothetical protein